MSKNLKAASRLANVLIYRMSQKQMARRLKWNFRLTCSLSAIPEIRRKHPHWMNVRQFPANKHNFGAVMAEAAIGLNFTVPATLKGSTTDDEMNVALNIKSLDDFSPDSVARQVPEVNKLLELREALTALKGPMGNLPAFRTQLRALLENEESREQLLKEIGR